jgi:hypothetical protein
MIFWSCTTLAKPNSSVTTITPSHTSWNLVKADKINMTVHRRHPSNRRYASSNPNIACRDGREGDNRSNKEQGECNMSSPYQRGDFRSSRSSQRQIPQRRAPARRPAQRSSRSMSSVRGRSPTTARSAFGRTSWAFRAARRFASPLRSAAGWRSTSHGSTLLPDSHASPWNFRTGRSATASSSRPSLSLRTSPQFLRSCRPLDECAPSVHLWGGVRRHESRSGGTNVHKCRGSRSRMLPPARRRAVDPGKDGTGLRALLEL